MDTKSNLIEVQHILQQILKPGKNSPYISSDEIYENDLLTKKALKIIGQTLEYISVTENSKPDEFAKSEVNEHVE